MFGCYGQSRPAQDADVVARALAVVALAALAVIHTVDLPGTLGPTPLVGIGYFGIIAVAMLAAAVMVVRSHWLVWGIAALSVETLIILLVAGWGAWQAQVHAANCPGPVRATAGSEVLSVVVRKASGR